MLGRRWRKRDGCLDECYTIHMMALLGWMHLESGMRKEGRKQRKRMLLKLGLASWRRKVLRIDNKIVTEFSPCYPLDLVVGPNI